MFLFYLLLWIEVVADERAFFFCLLFPRGSGMGRDRRRHMCIYEIIGSAALTASRQRTWYDRFQAHLEKENGGLHATIRLVPGDSADTRTDFDLFVAARSHSELLYG
jgi:hypothetical protein